MTLSQSPDNVIVEDPASNSQQPLVRAFADHTPKWQRFQVTTTTTTTTAALPPSANNNKTEQNFPFQRQYSHVYHQRLAALKPRCWESMENDNDHGATTTSGTPPPILVSRILELREDVPSQVVGTLVKECGSPDEKCIWTNKKCRASDYLVLEDASGRVSLDFDVSCNATVHQYCTGLVVGVHGVVGMNGVMKVEKFYAPAPVAHPSVPLQVRVERDAHVLLLSGLQLGDPSSVSLARDGLLSYLDGMLQPHVAAKICRVVIAGGSIAANSLATGSDSGTFQAHHYSGAASSSSAVVASSTPHSIQELDAFCAQILAMGIPVDLLPGRDDPTTATWPQRPLHSSLFPLSRAISAAAQAASIFYQTPNPYAAIWGDKLALGTDGTNVIDLVESTNNATRDEMAMMTDQETSRHENVVGDEGSEELIALAKTLEWGHVCPTGPDSVPTMPHAESDPLVIREAPYVYFMGNAKSFSSSLVCKNNPVSTKTRLVCVPQFGRTGQAVLVGLETLDVQLLRFVAPNSE